MVLTDPAVFDEAAQAAMINENTTVTREESLISTSK